MKGDYSGMPNGFSIQEIPHNFRRRSQTSLSRSMTPLRSILRGLAPLMCLGFLVARSAYPQETTTAASTGGPFAISLTVEGGKLAFELGEPIPVSAKLINTSGFEIIYRDYFSDRLFYTIAVWVIDPAGLRRNRKVEITNEGIMAGRISSLFGKMADVKIPPGGTHRPVSIDLSRHYFLSAKGHYRVVFSRTLRNPMNPATVLDVTSNEILFTIK